MLALLAGLLLAQVPTGPTAPTGPAPPDYDQQIEQWLERKFADPGSLQKRRLGGPEAVAYVVPPVNKRFMGRWIAGWASCYSINAKNAYGAYVGYRNWVFIVSAEGVQGIGPTEARSSELYEIGRRLCVRREVPETVTVAVPLDERPSFRPAQALTPADIPTAVRERLRPTLKDAESAQVRVTRSPRVTRWALTETVSLEGEAICAMVNSKNSYGAYTGEREYVFLFRDGGITYAPTDDRGVFAEFVSTECAKPADPGR